MFTSGFSQKIRTDNRKEKKKGKKVTIPIIANLTLRALVGVHLHTFTVLHGYFSHDKTSGPTMKVAGSEALLYVVL